MEEGAALREIVKKALEGKGVLAQIRASLRAAVFTVVDEHERALGVHVPSPSALRVKQDAGGRLALQVVADFLEHWQLHQTLSILKLETDLAAEDLLSREELGLVAGSDAAAAAGGTDREEKNYSAEDVSAPVLSQLLSRCCATSQIAGSAVPPRVARSDGGRGGGVGQQSSLSSCLRHGGNPQSWSPREHTEQEIKGDTGRGGDEEQEKGDGGREGAVDADVKRGLPSRVTLRKRRAGNCPGNVNNDANYSSNSTSLNDDIGGNASRGRGGGMPFASDAAAAGPAGVGGFEEGFQSTSSDPQSRLPPQPALFQHQDEDAGESSLEEEEEEEEEKKEEEDEEEQEEEAEEVEEADALCIWRQSMSGAKAGQDERTASGDAQQQHGGGYHFDGSMDESSYHFSEDAESVSAASPSAPPSSGGRYHFLENAEPVSPASSQFVPPTIDGGVVLRIPAGSVAVVPDGAAGPGGRGRIEYSTPAETEEAAEVAPAVMEGVGAGTGPGVRDVVGRLDMGQEAGNGSSPGKREVTGTMEGGRGDGSHQGGERAARFSVDGGGGVDSSNDGGDGDGSLVGGGGGGGGGADVERETPQRASVGGGGGGWGNGVGDEDSYEDDDFDVDDGDELEGRVGAEVEEAWVPGGDRRRSDAAGAAAEDDENDELEQGEEDHSFGASGGHSDDDAERIANLDWEARVGLSADSSVAVGPGEEDDLENQAYEIEDAQSVE